MASFPLDITQNSQRLTQLQQCHSVRVHSYPYVPHWKVKQHFIYVQYGCVKQSKVVYSLNHDIMASFLLNSHQELPKSDPALAVLPCKGALICLRTSLKGAKKIIYVHYGCGKLSKVVYSLNHDIMTSLPLDSHQEMPKSDPALPG